jgi:hypothetical protein
MVPRRGWRINKPDVTVVAILASNVAGYPKTVGISAFIPNDGTAEGMRGRQGEREKGQRKDAGGGWRRESGEGRMEGINARTQGGKDAR